MPLLSTDEEWLATIEGAPHLSCRFWMPAGDDAGQAAYRAWQIWSPARLNNDPDRPQARQGLTVTKLATTFVELPSMPTLQVAA